MRTAEGVVDINLAETGQGLSEGRIVFLFLSMEPDVLEQSYFAFRHPGNEVFGFLADAIGAKKDRLSNQLLKSGCHRPKRIFFDRLALWPAEMRHQNNFRAMLAQIVDRGQAFANSRIIGHYLVALALLQRHIEVHPHKDAFPFHIDLVQR